MMIYSALPIADCTGALAASFICLLQTRIINHLNREYTVSENISPFSSKIHVNCISSP